MGLLLTRATVLLRTLPPGTAPDGYSVIRHTFAPGYFGKQSLHAADASFMTIVYYRFGILWTTAANIIQSF